MGPFQDEKALLGGQKNEDRYSAGVTEDINRAIKAAARSIMRTKLSDKICSKENRQTWKLK